LPDGEQQSVVMIQCLGVIQLPQTMDLCLHCWQEHYSH
jgi:hypothetical protein